VIRKRNGKKLVLEQVRRNGLIPLIKKEFLKKLKIITGVKDLIWKILYKSVF